MDVDCNGHVEFIATALSTAMTVNSNDNSDADRESNGVSNGNSNGSGNGKGVGDWGSATLPFLVKMVSGILTNPNPP